MTKHTSDGQRIAVASQRVSPALPRQHHTTTTTTTSAADATGKKSVAGASSPAASVSHFQPVPDQGLQKPSGRPYGRTELAFHHKPQRRSGEALLWSGGATTPAAAAAAGSGGGLSKAATPRGPNPTAAAAAHHNNIIASSSSNNNHHHHHHHPKAGGGAAAAAAGSSSPLSVHMTEAELQKELSRMGGATTQQQQQQQPLTGRGRSSPRAEATATTTATGAGAPCTPASPFFTAPPQHVDGKISSPTTLPSHTTNTKLPTSVSRSPSKSKGDRTPPVAAAPSAPPSQPQQPSTTSFQLALPPHGTAVNNTTSSYARAGAGAAGGADTPRSFGGRRSTTPSRRRIPTTTAVSVSGATTGMAGAPASCSTTTPQEPGHAPRSVNTPPAASAAGVPPVSLGERMEQLKLERERRQGGVAAVRMTARRVF